MNAAADIRARLPNSSRLWSRLALAFILLLGAVRLAVIGCCAPLVPFWDEWTATANLILKPWHESRHVSWSMLWAPHNDHRIVLTRLWEIGWFTILGEWDPTFVATINALILAAAQAGFVIWIGHRWHTRARLLWMLVAGALLVVPFGYANLLVAFQSQFHFLTALGLIALVAAVRVEDSRWGAPIAITASAFALFSTGAGLLVALAVGCLAVLQTVVRRRVLPRTAVLWACSIVIFVAGWRIRPPPTFGPATFARTALATTRYAGWPASNLANLIAGWPESVRYLPLRVGTWPSAEKPAIVIAANFMQRHPTVVMALFGTIALITFLPALILLLRLLSAGDPSQHATEWALVGLAGWSALNALGMAAARSGDLLVPPRYQDLLGLGLLANAGALFALAKLPLPAYRTSRLLIALWTLPTGAALAFTAIGVMFVQLPRKAAESAGARRTVQAYVASGDPELFRDRPTNFVPWPGGETQLAKLLLDPTIRALLPVELRAPPMAPSLAGRAVRGLLRVAPVVAALGALLFCILIFRDWRPPATNLLPTGLHRY